MAGVVLLHFALIIKLREIGWQSKQSFPTIQRLALRSLPISRKVGDWFHEIFVKIRIIFSKLTQRSISFFFVKSSLLTTPAHAMFCSRFSSSQIPFVFDNIFSRNLFHFTTAHALYQFHEIFQNEFPFKTVFGMSEISWYYSLLFWLILEEEPNWKNFKTKSDATLIRDEITKPLTPF